MEDLRKTIRKPQSRCPVKDSPPTYKLEALLPEPDPFNTNSLYCLYILYPSSS